MIFQLIFFNRYFDKNRLKALILWNLTQYGEKKTLDLVEKLKDFGFHYATEAGLSLGVDDLKIPPTKAKLILEAEMTLQFSQKDYDIGNLTIVEKMQQLIDVWHRTSEILKQKVVYHFRSTDILNPVYMMAFSGARGNISQVRQLVGMRGLMADPQGQILDFPIRSNFREGLTLTEYVISCYGARKGLVDTALRTANSGYLTRRLVDVAQHIIVRKFDCETTKGIRISDLKDGKKITFSLQKRLIGRVLAEPVEKIAKKNQDISPSLSLKIVKLRNQVFVRSPLSCEAKNSISGEAKNSICQLCYGWSLAHGSLVSLGEAVGILAAQSIGEPGTQLTMRTFHTGGVFSGDVMQEIRSPFDGTVKFLNTIQGILIRTLHGKIAFLTKAEGKLIIFNEKDSTKISYNIPVSTVLFIRESEYVKERQLLAEYSSVVTHSNQGIQANYSVNSSIEGQIYFEDVLLVIKIGKKGDIIKIALRYGSLWILSGKLYQSAIRSNLFIRISDLVDTDAVLNESIFVTPETGYLKIVAEEKIYYKFFNKKYKSFFNQKNFLNKLLIGQQNINKNTFISCLKRKTYSLKKKIFLNQIVSTICFKKIQYRKFGYFIFLINFDTQQIFLTNSLKEKNIPINLINLTWLSKTKVNIKSSIIVDKNFFNQEKGQFFLIPENFYKIKVKKIDKIYNFNQFKILEKKQRILFFKNKQGNKLNICSLTGGFITTKSQTNIEKLEKFLINFEKKNKIFSKNPNIKILPLKNFKKKFLFKTHFLKKKFPSYFKLNKKKIRQKNFYYENYNSLKLLIKYHKQKCNFAKNIFFKPENPNFIYVNNEKNKIFKFKIKSGWNFLLKNNSKFCIVNKLFLAPTYKINNYHFDQHYISIENYYVNNSILFLLKINYLSKIRFLKNILFRYNRNQYLKNKFLKLDKKNNKRNQNPLLQFFKKENQVRDQLTNVYFFYSTVIKRNIIYKKNYSYNNLFILEIIKTIEMKKVTKLKEKKIYQKIIKPQRNFNFFDLKLFWLNKQKITKTEKPFPSVEIQIQTNHVTDLKKFKDYLFNPKNIYFSLQKNLPLTKGQLKLKFNQSLNFSINKKVESFNSLFNEKQNQPNSKSKILITKSNQISEQNILTFKSFSSPFQAEITTIKTELIGQDKILLLTSNDKSSFTINKTPILIKLGELVRYGDLIIQNIGSPESGQIIQIDKKKITLRKAQPILFSSQGIFHVDNGDIIEKNTPLITLFYQKLKTEDIVQGIPKIEELFEARQTKEGEPLQENLHTKLKTFFYFYKQQNKFKEAVRKSIEKIQQILVTNVQKVYQSQGVSIADKHIEIIVRQMTTKVKITESGRTGLLRGELVDLEWVEIINLGIEVQNKIANEEIEIEKAKYEPIILGITKAALETESFISASSFQETTRILSRAAIQRKTDFLRGLKENVILGHLIPAGTGLTFSFNFQIKKFPNNYKISSLSYTEIIKLFSKKTR